MEFSRKACSGEKLGWRVSGAVGRGWGVGGGRWGRGEWGGGTC